MKHFNQAALQSRQAIKGFTLIEFLVASVLSLIVIMAAGSIYFLTRQLNETSQQRLAVQQNLRNATTQIMRDARMAGSFGCYNTSSDITARENADFSKITNTNLKIDASADNGWGVRQAKISGKDAIIFVYGISDTGITAVNTLQKSRNSQLNSVTIAKGLGSDIDPLRQTLNNGGPVVLSSCRMAYGIPLGSRVTGDTINLGNLNTTFREHDVGELTLTKLYAAAYYLDGEQLVRQDIGSNGTFQPPQLIATGIKSMTVGFGYTKDCQLDTLSTDSDYKEETYTFRKDLATTDTEKSLPSLVQIRLTYETNVSGSVGNGTTATVTPSAVAEYVINAAVRGGNTCGNRTPIPAST